MSGRVSVVIPCFNAGSFLREAIESVLAQGESIGQLIVVDDGSEDDSADVAASFPAVTLFRRANGGCGAARNTGVAAASGELLAFLDADDTWPDGRMANLLAVLESDRSFDAVFGMVVEFGEGRPDTESQRAQLASTMLIRRASYDRVGSFREDVKVGEFIDWWARARDAGLRHASIPDVVLRRRIHTTNTGIVHRDSRVDFTRVLRDALARRRQG